MTPRNEKNPPLKEGILTALRAIESQITREIQRTPKEIGIKGVGKEDPMNTRVESITSFIVESLGAQGVSLESALVLARSFTKAAYILSDELGHKGLGSVRARYCETALQEITTDAAKGVAALRNEREVM